MKHTRNFVFDTPINVPAYLTRKAHTTLCYARVEGKGYYYDQSHGDTEIEDDPESLYGFDIEKVILKEGTMEQDSTIAYRVSKQLSDTFCGVIKDATEAHMSYLFDDMVAEYWKREPTTRINEVEHTDTQQGKTYQIIAMSGTPEKLLKAS